MKGTNNILLKNVEEWMYPNKIGRFSGVCFLAFLQQLQNPSVLFPDSSVGKEYICNAGDPGLIPGSGRSAGEGIGYPLQYSWASLVAQLVKNLPVMQEIWV